MKTIHILIADRQTLTREGIISVLAPVKDITVIGTAANKPELEQWILAEKPQVVIMDHHFGDHFSIDDIRQINLLYPYTRVLILSDTQERDEILALSEQGINYICKTCSRTEIIEAVYATVKGEKYFCESTRETLFGNGAGSVKAGDTAALSTREIEVVRLIADGLTNKEIGENLFISIHTIKTHRKNIIKKLGFTFKNAAELALYTQSL